MTELILAKFDSKKFEWKSLPSKDGSQRRIRVLAGGEYTQEIWNRLVKGDQTLFFATYADLATPIPESKLLEASRNAWIWLRYEIPTIATSAWVDENDISTLEYASPTPNSVEEWADRTFTLHKQDKIDLDAIRREEGKKKVPSSAGDQTWLHIVPGAAGANGAISNFGLLFHTHHAPFDGTALKILFTRYFKLLSKSLNGAKESFQWGNEADNLLPAVFNILAPSEPIPIPPDSSEEPSFTHPYYGTLGGLLQSIGETLQDPYGFKPRKPDEGWPSPKRQGTEFTKEESDTILKKLKSIGSSEGYTVTHLAHSALALVVISDNPPVAEAATQYLNNLSLIDCRNRLKEPYSSREGYAGYALGVGAMRIPVTTFLSEDGKALPLNKDLLLNTLKVIRGLYAAQATIPAPLSYMGQGAEIFCANIKQAITANQLPPNQNYMFSSDGLGEKYLDPVYTDDAGFPILTVTKFFTSLNRTDPGPFFRISSWNGIIDLSVDYNSNATSDEDVKQHLARWKEYMLLVSEF